MDLDQFGGSDDTEETTTQQLNSEQPSLTLESITNSVERVAKTVQASRSVDGHNAQVNSQSDIPIEFNDPDSPGALFVKWLVAGIRDGSIPINNPGNRVHHVKEGLFLVSPSIFRDFSSASGIDYAKAQRGFQRLLPAS